MQGDGLRTGAPVQREARSPIIRRPGEVAVAEQRREAFPEGNARHVEGSGHRRRQARGGEHGRREEPGLHRHGCSIPIRRPPVFLCLAPLKNQKPHALRGFCCLIGIWSTSRSPVYIRGPGGKGERERETRIRYAMCMQPFLLGRTAHAELVRSASRRALD